MEMVKKILHKTMKAQYTLYAMLMTVLTIIAYTAVYPILDTIITGSGITGMEGTILGYIPLFILLFIIWSSAAYVAPPERD